jgi:protein CpxP
MLAQSSARPGFMSPEQQQAQLNALTNAVGLTPDQVRQVQAINAHTISQTLDIRNSGDDPETAGSKIKAIQRIQRTNIKALLTEEQKPKFDAYLAMQHGAPDRSPSPAPPQWLLGEMTSVESAEFGSIMRWLVAAVKAVTGAHRVYFLSVNEHAPHFHLWLVPKKKNTTLEGVPFLARRPVPATKSGAEAMSRKIRKQFDRSWGSFQLRTPAI